MIKAIFVDLDNTLLNDKKLVSREDIEQIIKAEERGIKVVITTGRSRKDGLEIQKLLKVTRYIISSNGADIYDLQENKIIYNSPIQKKSLEKIYEISNQNKLKISINTESELYINKLTYQDENDLLISDDKMKEYIRDKDIVQIVISNKDRIVMKQVKNQIMQLEGLKIENQSLGLIDGCEKISKNYFCDIINSCNNKANAIKKLCKYLNINLDEIAAIGDSPNDIPMLEIAKDKVAMGNATEEVKKIANIITSTNTDGGVGKYIESILKS